YLPLCGCTSISARPGATQFVVETGALDATARSNLQGRIEEVRLGHGIPGLGFAVIRHGKLSFFGVAGYRAADRVVPIAPGDQFELSSNSKEILAAVAGTLVREGDDSWSCTVHFRSSASTC